jgi:small subunit ribosomal protein S2
LLGLLREQDKLERSLGGIKEMGGVPNLLFVVDTNKEAIAIAEARKLAFPSWRSGLQQRSRRHCLPDPGNDDAARAIALYCDLAARAVIDGLGKSQSAAGVDWARRKSRERRSRPGEAATA